MDHSRFSNFSTSLRLYVITGKTWSPKVWRCSHYTLLAEPGLCRLTQETIRTSGRGGSQPSPQRDLLGNEKSSRLASKRVLVAGLINCSYVFISSTVYSEMTPIENSRHCNHACWKPNWWKSHRLLGSSGLTLLISIKGEKPQEFITWPVTLLRHYCVLYIP